MNFVHYIFNGQHHHLGWIRVFDEETSLTKKVVTDAFNLFSRWQCQVELIIYMLTEIKNFFLQSQLEKVSFYVDFYLK